MLRSARPLAIILILAMSATVASAQRSIDPSTMRAIDSALAVIGMRASDMTMPPDLIDHDRHRTAMHDRLFTEPLRAFDEASVIADASVVRTDSALRVLFRTLMERMELGTFDRIPYEGRLTADETIEGLGVDPTTRMNLIGSFIVLRYLSPIVQAIDGMSASRSALLKDPFVTDQADSLWRISREDEDAGLFELATKERAGRQIAEQFYASVAPRALEPVYQHGLSLYLQFLDLMRQAEDNMSLLRDSVRTTTFKTRFGRVAIGGSGNDVYEGSYAVIIDIGGNDVYRLDDTTKIDAMYAPIRCIIDLDGDDLYQGGDFSFGSGYGGVGIAIDRRGDDVYIARDFSMGCGVLGIGIMHDLDGSDTYLSGSNTQGAGIFGLGLHFDDAGHDTYRCHAQAQGFGGTRGVGLMRDLSGNDRYVAASPYVDVLRYDAHQVTFVQGAALGSRPIASGGIGMLVDATGNDLYVSDIYGQGTGYWFGLGALVDMGGDDRYESYQYAQGAGVHFATGILRDRTGDDVYVSHGVSMGCGHDIATGALLDESGNDSYVCESLSLGGGNANAISLFVDERGNDAYIALNTSNTMGFSDLRRSYGMIGLFIDMAGTDVYGETTRNNTISTKSTYGAFFDRPGTSERAAPPTVEPRRVDLPLAGSVDSLFIQASAAPLRFQGAVEPARTKLGSMGVAALTALIPSFGTSMPRERLALETILPRLYASDRDTTLRALLAALNSDDPATMTLGCTVLGKVKAPEAVIPLIIATTDSSWKRRRLAAFTLGQIGDTSARIPLANLLRDEHPYVRQRAAHALGSMTPSMFDLVRSALEADEQIVRYAAIEGLVRGPKVPASVITSWLRTVNDRSAIISGIRLFAAADTTANDLTAFDTWYASAPQWVRTALISHAPQLPSIWRDHVTAAASGTTKRKKSKRP